ncbi:MAG TPA: TOMM precursor leader peptide-binding protein [Bryobacteraceae bacterium]|jgi:bacteriocin biosynthesis cyclodehydratase domain-containing protein|nr:TOMM precursor leader peptide-binding protein [Bryobacteraceae bacterium]
MNQPATEAVGTGRLLQLVEMYTVPMSNGALHLKSPGQSAEIRGSVVHSLIPKLLPLLDGTRTLEQVKGELGSTFPAQSIEQIVSVLEKKGLVREVESVPPELASDDLWQLETMARYFGTSGSRYATLVALRKAHIGILNSGPVAPLLISALAKFGVRQITLIAPDTVRKLEAQQCRVLDGADAGRRWSDVLSDETRVAGSRTRVTTVSARPEDVGDWGKEIEGMNMMVALVQGPILFYPWLEKLNLAAVSQKIPWTSVALLDGDVVHVGPTIRPRVTACYKCYELRYKSHLPYVDRHDAFAAHVHRLDQPLDFGLAPPVADILAGFAAMEVVRAISPDSTPVTSGRLMTFSLSEFKTELHPVLKLPRCSHCSSVNGLPPQRIWS